ncbi:hypothetical protein HSB1_47030 [Halogranum salarium B-1]|uniref:ArsR family transcriptional regulator n=2 Tax=Halogranum rubrum TaxID=553466 RepID=J3JCT1_9EURY|nr:hypothetical protein HSB1_47030 [Halogranum salarium B-1]
MVVETLDEPATITEIADKADVAWATADSELDTLLAANKVQKQSADGKTLYALNPVQLLFEEVLDLINEHSREELESRLVEHQSQLESLQAEYGVETLAELRDRLVHEELSAAEMQDNRKATSTWGALETELRLTKHALQFYDDVTQFSRSDGDERLSVA